MAFLKLTDQLINVEHIKRFKKTDYSNYTDIYFIDGSTMTVTASVKELERLLSELYITVKGLD